MSGQAIATTAKHVLPLTEINKFEDFISAPAVLERIRVVLPHHLNAERMMRTVALAAYKTPKLREIHMMSLLGAVMTLASLGLEPNTPLGHAYLIPFDKNKYDRSQSKWVLDRVDVNVIIGYPGLIDLARRTGSLVSITAKIVYQGDEWSYEYGSNQHLRHRPVGLTAGRKPTHAYAFSKLTDGEAFEVLPYGEALSFRRYSQAYLTAAKQIEDAAKNSDDAWKAKSAAETPWIKHEPQMVQKTMIRRLSNWLPKSINFAAAMRVDQMAEAGKIDYAALASAPIGEAREMLEAGVVPEQIVENRDDDAPETRPEPERGGKRKAKTVSETSVGQAAKARQEPASSTEQVDKEPGEVTGGAKDEPSQELSEDLEQALQALSKTWVVEEIDGARDHLRTSLTPDDFKVWQTASLQQQRKINANKR